MARKKAIGDESNVGCLIVVLSVIPLAIALTVGESLPMGALAFVAVFIAMLIWGLSQIRKGIIAVGEHQKAIAGQSKSERDDHDEDEDEDEDWKDDPATERQMDYADDLGIKYDANVTKGELSRKIDRALDKES